MHTSRKTWFLRPSLCKPCGGKCCKSMPGAAHPHQFPQPEDVVSALESGLWAVDWWEGDARPGQDELSATYYLRPATKGSEGQRLDASWGGECTFLTPSGCELAPTQRPRGCLNLVPSREGCASSDGTNDKRVAAIAWIPRAHELIGDTASA